MAKPKGPLKIKGKLGDLSFYDSVFGPIVRRKGGPDKKQIQKKKSFGAVRRNNSEFGKASAAGKLMRRGMIALLKQVYDHRLVWRVTQLMVQLKNLDSVSEWGQRNVSNGIRTEAGQQLLHFFEFNSNMPLAVLLKRDYVIDEKQRLILHDFVPARDLKRPKGATHVVIKSALLHFDPDGMKTQLTESNAVRLKIDRKSIEVILEIVQPSVTKGIVLHLLQICFLDENNSGVLPKRKTYNGFGVVKVR